MKTKWSFISAVVGVMSAVSIVATLSAIGFQYRAGLEQARVRLADVISSQASLIDAVEKFDAHFSADDHAAGSWGATLSQIGTALGGYHGVGESEEFLVGQLRGGMIHVILGGKSLSAVPMTPLAWQQSHAEPMRRALNGATGVMIGYDRRGAHVMAAYGPVERLDIGLVAKIDMAELRAPYLHAAGAALFVAFALVILGSLILVYILRPVYVRLTKQNESLQMARDGLARAQAITHLGHWEWDIRGNNLVWSDEIYRIFGLRPQEFAATYEGFVEHIHPDDVEKVQSAVDQALENAEFKYHVEHRVRRPSGEVRHVLECGKVVRGGAGEPISMLGTVQDITERKEAEEKLLLSDQVFRNSGEAIMVTAPDGTIISVNDAFCTVTGYSSEEVVGRRPGVMKSNRHPESFYRQMWQTLLEKGSWSGEVWDRRKNGTDYPKSLNINSVKNDAGKVCYYISIFKDITDAKNTEQQLQHLAFYDSLTQLPNRVLCREQGNQALRVAHRSGQRLAVLFLDLDRFKGVNDTLGHSSGDLLLIEAAKRIQRCVRESDIVSRLGGDEFMVIVNDIEHVKSVEHISNKILKALSDKFLIRGGEVNIGASIGISLYPENGDDFDELTKNADAAMYKAKEAGRNTFSYFTSEMQEAMVRQLALEKDLRKALENDEMIVHYQPKVRADDGYVFGMEALVRWESPSRGLVLPGEFISLAEDTGLILRLSEQVLQNACSQTASWHAAGCIPLKVSVNLSVRQFEQDNLVDMVETVLLETGLPAESLELEITESTLMRDASRAVVMLGRFRDLGITVSIDDFGTGYSSLAYLKRLPIQGIKIDRSFVHDFGYGGGDETIVSGIISMAKALGLEVIAEGVETRDQLDYLRKEGCNRVQGYLLSKPMSASDFGCYLKTRRSECFGDTTQKDGLHLVS